LGKTGAVLLVLVFLIASCMAVKPAFSLTEVTENTWITKTPMRHERYGLGVAVVNGKIYAIGGSSEEGTNSYSAGYFPTSGKVLNTVEEYDPATDTWTSRSSMPTARYSFATIVCQNRIYCLGGNTYRPKYGSPTTTDAFEVYDPQTNNWTKMTPMPTKNSLDAVISYEDKIYFFGGGLNQVYDTVSDTWENKTSMPTARKGLITNVVDDKFYVMGDGTNITEVYDPATDSWATKASMPEAVYGSPSSVIDGKIYVISSLLQIHDSESDSWTLGAQPPQHVYGKALATEGIFAPKQICLLMGQTMLLYDPIGDSWISTVGLSLNLVDYGVILVDDRLYVVGGFTSTTSPNKMGIPFIPPDYTIYPSAVNMQYTPIGYGTIPPKISVISPRANMSYSASNCSLVFSLNKPADSISYSIDGKEKVVVTGNTTIPALSGGQHSIVVYAEDSYGNTGISEIIYFSVDVPFPTTLVIASVITVAIVGAGLLVYFKKRKH
jgi:hypothetical protein